MLFFMGANFVQKNTVIVKKTLSMIKGENEEQNSPEVHTVNIVLNELNNENNQNIDDCKIRLSYPENLSIKLYGISNNDLITPDEGEEFAIPECGAKLQVDGVHNGRRYEITIEQASLKKEYKSTFKSMTIEINSENNELKACIKQIIKEVDGEEVVTNGSEANTAIFMYETDENSNIKIKENENLELVY